MNDFNRTSQAQEAFKEKRKPKGPIKFNIQLNEEQKRQKKGPVTSESRQSPGQWAG